MRRLYFLSLLLLAPLLMAPSQWPSNKISVDGVTGLEPCEVSVWEQQSSGSHALSSTPGPMPGIEADWSEVIQSDCWEWGGAALMEWKYTCAPTAQFRLTWTQALQAIAAAARGTAFRWLAGAAPLVTANHSVGRFSRNAWGSGINTLYQNVAYLSYEGEISQNQSVGINSYITTSGTHTMIDGRVTMEQTSNCLGKQ